MRAATLRHLGTLPVALFLALFFAAPLANLLAYSFLTYKGLAGASWPLTMANILQALQLKHGLTFLKSLALSGGVTLACFILGLSSAFHLAKKIPKKRQYFFLFLLTLPFWTSSLSRLYGWYFLLGAHGPINSLLMQVGLIHEPLPLLFNTGACFVGLLYNNLPYMILPVYGVLSRMDNDLLEAAQDLFAGKWQLWRHVIIPLAAPGWIAGGLLVLIASLTDFITIEVLSGAKHLFAASLIQNQFLIVRNWPLGSALTLAFFLMSLAVLGLGLGLLSKKFPYALRRERLLSELGEGLAHG